MLLTAVSSRSSRHGELGRRLLAEFVGTGLLVTVVVGSGIAAAALSSNDIGLQLLENSTATACGLAVLILLFGPLSGAHFNPLVSAADWLLGRQAGTGGLTGNHLAGYMLVQVLGGAAGAMLANLMFDRHVLEVSTKNRITTGHLVGEVVATAGLIALIFALARTHRAGLSAAAVGAYIGAAYWFTSSTSFANPAVTIGRIFSDTFAGIAPNSVPGFITAQTIGALIGLALVAMLYPDAARSADQVVVPHIPDRSTTPGSQMTKPTVLFLCTHNAGRSQMALGFFNHLAGDQALAYSGGSEPAANINPSAVAAMAESGIDITTEQPKRWTDTMLKAADVIVTMGCGDTCPVYPGRRYEEWALPDPAGQPLDAVRPIRDEIEQRVRQLISELSITTPQA